MTSSKSSSKENEFEKLYCHFRLSSRSKTKKFQIDFFFEFFFSLCFFIFAFFIYQSFSCLLLLDSKLIEKSSQLFFLKNFSLNLLIFFNSLFFSLFLFLTDQTIFLIYQFKEIQKADLKSKIFKSAFKVLIKIIIKFYTKSIDSASKLTSDSNNRKLRNKKKINQIENSIFSFSKQWIIDEFLLIKSVNQLFRSIYVFQNSFAFKTITDSNSIFFVKNISNPSSFHISIKNLSRSIVNSFKKSSIKSFSIKTERILLQKTSFAAELNEAKTNIFTNTSKVLAIIEKKQKNSKKFVSIFHFVRIFYFFCSLSFCLNHFHDKKSHFRIRAYLDRILNQFRKKQFRQKKFFQLCRKQFSQ